MAHYFIFPEKDTTIFSHPSDQTLNAGIDEILTIEDKESFTNLGFFPSRVLLQFNTDELKNTIQSKVLDKDFTANLKFYQTEHRELSIDQNFEVFPLAQAWNNGTGRKDNNPQITDGCSWIYRDGSPNAILNDPGGTEWTTTGFATGVTASFSSSVEGGGVWYFDDNIQNNFGFMVSRSYGYDDDLDLSFNVSNPVKKHYSGSIGFSYPDGIPNYGFILKRADTQEFTEIDDGQLNFFSRDTHTIYPPYLDISWDDSNYDTTFATDDKIKQTGECYVTLRNNKEEFKTIEEPTFRLNVRELYPTRKFVTSSNFLDVNYFTSESFYSLVDYATEETIIPFGSSSKLSADAEGMYFKIYMNGLQEGRYYKLLFKHNNQDGIRVYDNNYYFKIVKS